MSHTRSTNVCRTTDDHLLFVRSVMSSGDGDDQCRYGDSSSYSSEHWALQRCTLTDAKTVALVFFERSDYGIYLNPEDKRGYRCIVRLIDNARMASTFNRPFTSSERIGLALTMALVTEAYSRVVPIAQNAVAGNNAHSIDPQTGRIQLGDEREPIFLHGHVFGRGHPAEEYVPNVPLDGPAPGVIFDMRAQSPDQPGNEKKVKWNEDQMKQVVARLKIELRNLRETYQTHGLTMITEDTPSSIYFVRHGRTDWNVQRRFQGLTDIPLNEQGEQEARLLRSKLTDVSFVKAISSDLIRARSTAEIILGSTKSTLLETSPLLRERSFGSWEGRSINELRAHLENITDGNHFSAEEYLSFKWDAAAESYTDIYERIQLLVRSLVLSSSTTHGPILLSSHAGVIRAILYHIDFHPHFRWQVSNCAFLKLHVHADGRMIIHDSDGVQRIKVEEATFPF